MKKLIVALSVLLLLSLGLNAYHYIYRYGFVQGQQFGINTVSNAVMQEYQNTGKVKIQLDGKQVFLVPEKTLAMEAEKLMK